MNYQESPNSPPLNPLNIVTKPLEQSKWLPEKQCKSLLSITRFQLANIDILRFNQSSLFDTTPLPDDIPKVKELGASSAPLLSAAFFIGARCRPYNDDFMQCKTENHGRAEMNCLKEGRRVTRCAASVYVHFSWNLDLHERLGFLPTPWGHVDLPFLKERRYKPSNG